jgi:hypothetical protein
MNILLKAENGTLEIKILRRKHSTRKDFDIGNLLVSMIDISIQSGFKAAMYIDIHASDLEAFYNNLINLKNNTSKEIRFESWEPFFKLHGKLDVTGNIYWDGTIESELDWTKLSFKLTSDNASIGHLADEVWKVLQEYPIVGRP